MKKLIYLLLFIPLLLSSQEYSREEKQLYIMIMKYRKKRGLPSIPLSSSLTFVAKVHTKDLIINKPDLGHCNGHSWSKNPSWSSVKYTGQPSQFQYMWDKPKELTPYLGNGFEIVCGSNDCCSNFTMTADYAFNSWKNSSKHNNIMVNKKEWKGRKKWKSIGISIEGGFATVWFGEEEDHWDCFHCRKKILLSSYSNIFGEAK